MQRVCLFLDVETGILVLLLVSKSVMIKKTEAALKAVFRHMLSLTSHVTQKLKISWLYFVVQFVAFKLGC